ncbi:hypothetical protein V8Z80_08175 [Orrella sp. JC864]|uniref:hypothetical protein n=1 Tax=Orrella sp. JC864 TaxID=3120298 RepID=UPI00300BC6D4
MDLKAAFDEWQLATAAAMEYLAAHDVTQDAHWRRYYELRWAEDEARQAFDELLDEVRRARFAAE